MSYDYNNAGNTFVHINKEIVKSLSELEARKGDSQEIKGRIISCVNQLKSIFPSAETSLNRFKITLEANDNNARIAFDKLVPELKKLIEKDTVLEEEVKEAASEVSDEDFAFLDQLDSTVKSDKLPQQLATDIEKSMARHQLEALSTTLDRSKQNLIELLHSYNALQSKESKEMLDPEQQRSLSLNMISEITALVDTLKPLIKQISNLPAPLIQLLEKIKISEERLLPSGQIKDLQKLTEYLEKIHVSILIPEKESALQSIDAALEQINKQMQNLMQDAFLQKLKTTPDTFESKTFRNQFVKNLEHLKGLIPNKFKVEVENFEKSILPCLVAPTEKNRDSALERWNDLKMSFESFSELSEAREGELRRAVDQLYSLIDGHQTLLSKKDIQKEASTISALFSIKSQVYEQLRKIKDLIDDDVVKELIEKCFKNQNNETMTFSSNDSKDFNSILQKTAAYLETLNY